MIEILSFVFGSFWKFVGTILLIVVFFYGFGWALNAMLRGFRGKLPGDF